MDRIRMAAALGLAYAAGGVGLVVGGAGGPAGPVLAAEGQAPHVPGPPGTEDDLRRTAVVRAVEAVSPAVVNIATDRILRQPVFQFPTIEEMLEGRMGARRWQEYKTQSIGSGFVVDPTGYVLTNSHVVAQGDAPPVGDNYPTSAWLPGQHLDDDYTLPGDPAIVEVALGLYRPADGTRLPAAQAGQRLPDDRVRIPLEGEPCRP